MFLIADLLERAKAQAGIDSDYRLAKVIGITHASVSTWRMGKSLPNEKVITQLCALSGDDPGLVAAQIQAARAPSIEAKTLWLMVAKRLAGGASTAILSVLAATLLIASYSMVPGTSGVLASESRLLTCYTSYEVRFFQWVRFVLVRLRRFPGFFNACLFGFNG